MSKESRAELEERIKGMTDTKLANLAATLVFIMLGPRALEVLGDAIQAHRAKWKGVI